MNHGFRLTPNVVVALAEGYRSGKTTTELAKMYNMSKASVCRGLRKMGIEPERHDEYFIRIEVPQEVQDKICEDFKAGIMHLGAICKKYEYSKQIINRVLEENNIHVEHRTYVKARLIKPETKDIKVGENKTKRLLSEKEQEELCDKWVNGPHTKAELAVEYQVHIDTVLATIRRRKCTAKKYLPEDVVDQMCEDYKGGIGVIDLAEIYNKDPELVRYHLTNRGLFGTTEERASAPEVDLGDKVVISTAAFRKMAQIGSPEMLKIIEDLARNPDVPARTRITAAHMAIEVAHGKPKEMHEEEPEKDSTVERILKLVPNKDSILKKKA